MQLGESMEDYLEAILVLSKCLDHVRSVDVASYFFSDMLQNIGVPKNIATEDACRIEHVISQETFEAIKKYYQNNKD